MIRPAAVWWGGAAAVDEGSEKEMGYELRLGGGMNCFDVIERLLSFRVCSGIEQLRVWRFCSNALPFTDGKEKRLYHLLGCILPLNAIARKPTWCKSKPPLQAKGARSALKNEVTYSEELDKYHTCTCRFCLLSNITLPRAL